MSVKMEYLEEQFVEIKTGLSNVCKEVASLREALPQTYQTIEGCGRSHESLERKLYLRVLAGAGTGVLTIGGFILGFWERIKP